MRISRKKGIRADSVRRRPTSQQIERLAPENTVPSSREIAATQPCLDPWVVPVGQWVRGDGRHSELGIVVFASLLFCLSSCVVLPAPPEELERRPTSSGTPDIHGDTEQGPFATTSVSEGSGVHGGSASTDEWTASASTHMDVWDTETTRSGHAEGEATGLESADDSDSFGDDVGCMDDHHVENSGFAALAWEEVRLPGSIGAQEVDLSETGDLWVISNMPSINPFPDFQILRRPVPDGPWIEVVGGATRVATLPDSGALVALSSHHSFRWEARRWIEIEGAAIDLDVGVGGHAWAIGVTELEGGRSVHRFDEIDGSFAWSAEALPDRGGQRIAVDQVGLPWVVDLSGRVWRWNGDSWFEIGPPGEVVTALAIGATGCGERAYVIVEGDPEELTPVSQPKLLGWAHPNGDIDNPRWHELGTNGVVALELTVDPSGWPWIVEHRGRLWRSRGKE